MKGQIMSLDIIRTIKKCMLKGNKVLRMSITVEGVFFIFLEHYTEQDSLKRKRMLWNGTVVSDANLRFDTYKNDPAYTEDGKE
jgi:hypothetical protein